MIESLTDQWMRAGSLLVQAPGYLRAWALTRLLVLNDLLGRPRMGALDEARLLELKLTELTVLEQVGAFADTPLR